MKLVVRNGTIVTPSGCWAADVVCADGRIASIAAGRPGAGAHGEAAPPGPPLSPGFIDPPAPPRARGVTHKEDFAPATRAAAAGGVTTLLEMPTAVPPVSDVSIFRER